MITVTEQTFKLDTDNTSYILRVLPTGQLEQLYYGQRLRGDGHNKALWAKAPAGGYANTVAYTQQDVAFCLDRVTQEYAGVGKGDFGEPAIELVDDRGCCVTDFCYQSHAISQGREPLAELPTAWGDCESLVLRLRDRVSGCLLELHYHLFAQCDAITRHARVMAAAPLRLLRLMSMQLDLPRSDYLLTSFYGGWADELQQQQLPLARGRYLQESKTGTSSNRHNPFFLLQQPDCTEEAGSCYGFNLLYSGNHCQIAEVSPHGRTRVLSGLSPFCFERTLQAGQSFDSPEAVLSFSGAGLSGLSHNLHAFVNRHIVRGYWAGRPRPVLFNSWEANYFDISEQKLVAQARAAKELGAELYVIDDGWFGNRDDDTSSLGDWHPNPRKLPGGLSGLADRFAELSIGLGLWVEPEMVSVDSDLHRAHPDWALSVPGVSPSVGRNQLVLDLSRAEVCDHIVGEISGAIAASRASYVKWDMNRNLSDVFSACAPHNGDLFHRYTLGCYRIMRAVTEQFPQVLFEGCAGGGNRFDLGVLCYMPQIWVSDNTDAHCRVGIQQGAGYGYPQSVQAAHVSACPNHQTGRVTPLDTRFGVAAFGSLGYELDLQQLSADEQGRIRQQIAWYKQHRQLLQYGQLHRLPCTQPALTGWVVLSPDKSQAVALLYQGLCKPNTALPTLRLRGLQADKTYRVREWQSGRVLCQAAGDLLCLAGLRLEQSICVDFGSLLLYIEQV